MSLHLCIESVWLKLYLFVLFRIIFQSLWRAVYNQCLSLLDRTVIDFELSIETNQVVKCALAELAYLLAGHAE